VTVMELWISRELQAVDPHLIGLFFLTADPVVNFFIGSFLLAFPLSLLFGKTVGFVFSFIPIYILCRILFKYPHPWLSCFKGVHRMLHAGGKQTPAVRDTRH